MLRRRLSIRWWLGALVAGGALPLLLLLIWIYEVQVRHEEAEARNTALRTARVTATRIRALHVNSLRLLQHMAASKAIRDLDQTPCDPLFTMVDFSPQYADMLLFDRAGTLVCSADPVPEDRPVSALARQWIAGQIRGGQLRVPATIMRPWASRWVSLLLIPVAGDQGTAGTLVLVQLPEVLAEPLPADAVMTILDRDSSVVARSTDLQQWTSRSSHGPSVAQLALHQGVGVAEAVDLDGVSRQYGFSTVPELGWEIYVGIPTTTARKEVREMFVNGVLGGSIIIILVIVLAFMLARTVERPVAALSRAAEAASGGAYTTVAPAGPSEVAQLADTFNNMLSRRLEAERRLMEDERELKALSERLLLVQEEERTRIARELHDDLGQSLTALKMDVGGLLAMMPSSAAGQPLRNRIMSTLDDTVTAVQRISSELRPGALDDFGLSAALEAEALRFEQRTGIECELSLPEQAAALVSGAKASAVYRIVQEALTNVARHANATRVVLDFRQLPEELLLEIRDDGRGITAGQISDPFSLGLIGIRERAGLAGGTVHFEGEAGRGTIVTVRIPSRTDQA